MDMPKVRLEHVSAQCEKLFLLPAFNVDVPFIRYEH